MLNRASKSALLWITVLLITANAQAGSITLTFDQLDDYAKSKSARAGIIEHQFEAVRAERDRQLQWSNPELSYGREDFDITEEYQFTLSKSFDVPWANLKKRSGWNDRVQSAQLQSEYEKLNLLSALRTGYVELQLLNEYLSRLEMFREVMTDASHVASERHTEGHLSGVEEHLIQMLVISLNASYQESLQLRRESESVWRGEIGIQLSDSLIMSSPIPYQAIKLQPASQYLENLKERPGYQYRRFLEQSLAKRASAEKGKFIPGLNIYGGYKRIEPASDGYVAGVSIEIPLFNHNNAAAKQLEIERRIVERENEIYFIEIETHIRGLVRSINEAQQSLGIVAEHFDAGLESLNSLVYSYEEGWLTLNELLNAIQIEETGLKDYYDLLISYYENIFQLEALTGTNLVSFEKQE